MSVVDWWAPLVESWTDTAEEIDAQAGQLPAPPDRVGNLDQIGADLSAAR